MRPIYFPYTFIPLEIAEAGAACFGRMVVYHPSGLELPPHMIELEKKGMLDIRVPVKGDEKEIRSLLNEYKRWAGIHKEREGVSLALQRFQKSQIPFFSESSIMKIRQDIQRKLDRADNHAKPPDPFLVSRVFLHMAHEFDAQHHEIDWGIHAVEKMEKELIRNLHGENSYAPDEKMVHSDNSFDFMVPERMEAWSGLMLQAADDPSGLFITSNRSVFAYVMENYPSGEMVMDLNHIPVASNGAGEKNGWRDAFAKKIDQCITSEEPISITEMPGMHEAKKTGHTVSFRAYRVVEEYPYDHFVRFFPHRPDAIFQKKESPEIRNIVFGFFETNI